MNQKPSRIVFIAPSSGGNFYCENCLRDIELAKSLIDRGLDVMVLPLYLPIEADLPKKGPIFFGGVNVFLQQVFAIFRHTPRWIDRWFDSDRLLTGVSRLAGMTSASRLGQTTISMLRGPNGRQRKELDRLLNWLSAGQNRTDVVCLSNALLLGLAGPISLGLGVPVICLLQDEDGFLDALPEPYSQQAWALVRSHSRFVRCFVAVSHYYARYMQQRLGLREEVLEVIPMGVRPDVYRPRQGPTTRPTIGYLSRLCACHGLDILVDAYIQLKESGLTDLRLWLCGGQERRDRPLVRSLLARLERMGMRQDVSIWSDFQQKVRVEFLSGLTVLCVPEKRPVAAARYALEALASGVPVVGPSDGVFPELSQQTGGILLYEQASADVLARTLKPLLEDRYAAFELGQQGRGGLLAGYSLDHTAERFGQLLQGIKDLV